MQKRFHIAYYITFEEAVIAKRKEQETKPDGIFQIRRKQGRFDLMERLTSKEAEIVRDYIQGKTKRHPRRKRPVKMS